MVGQIVDGGVVEEAWAVGSGVVAPNTCTGGACRAAFITAGGSRMAPILADSTVGVGPGMK